MMPSCDQIGVPIHFHSSTTAGSASLMSLRTLLRVSPRQSPSSAILFEISSDADGLWLAPDFFMFSSRFKGFTKLFPGARVDHLESIDRRQCLARHEDRARYIAQHVFGVRAQHHLNDTAVAVRA